MVTPADATTGFHIVDYVIFTAFLVISTSIGIFYACRGGKQRTNNEFLMGNRKLRTLPVAISIVVSFISGIMVLGHPVEMYTRGSQFSMRMVGHVIACVLSAILFVPMFFRLRVTSSFEYLEARYRSKCVKVMGTITILFSMVTQMGIVLYGPAVALQAVNGIPVWISIVVTSAVAICYTTLGGMKAVIYADVFQALCMVIGMLAIVIQGTIEVGSPSKVLELNSRDSRIEFFNFNPDPTVRASFWSTVFGGLFFSLSIFGIGQTTVQRYCALPTLQQAKCSLLLNAIFLVLIYCLATAVGFVVYAYYANIGCDPIRAKYITSQNQLIPYFIRNVLNYPGLSGAFLAVLFGGALSTMSSNLNSAAAISWQDIVKYFFEHLSETRRAIVTKILVLLYGALGIGIAFSAKYMGSHVMQGATAVIGTFSGPTLGLFMLGAIFPIANSKGAVIGCSIATVFNIWIAVGSLVYNPDRNILPTSVEKCNATAELQFQDLNTTEFDTFWNPSSFNASAASPESFWTTIAATNDDSITNSHISIYKNDAYSGLLNFLYSISFNLYPVIGCLNTIIIGLIVSLVTGHNDDSKTDPHLLVPIFDRLCCCLPSGLRRRLRCGVEHKENEGEMLSSENPVLLNAKTKNDSCWCCWVTREESCYKVLLQKRNKHKLRIPSMNPNCALCEMSGKIKDTRHASFVEFLHLHRQTAKENSSSSPSTAV